MSIYGGIKEEMIDKEAKVPFESFNGYGKGQFLMAVYKSLSLFQSAG